jgi:hypothetical protein
VGLVWSKVIVSDEAVASVFRTEAMTTVSAGIYQITQSYVPEYIKYCIHRRRNINSHTDTQRLSPGISQASSIFSSRN